MKVTQTRERDGHSSIADQSQSTTLNLLFVVHGLEKRGHRANGLGGRCRNRRFGQVQGEAKAADDMGIMDRGHLVTGQVCLLSCERVRC
jgi:hypothetical protein